MGDISLSNAVFIFIFPERDAVQNVIDPRVDWLTQSSGVPTDKQQSAIT
jgi:hypothetical protein